MAAKLPPADRYMAVAARLHEAEETKPQASAVGLTSGHFVGIREACCAVGSGGAIRALSCRLYAGASRRTTLVSDFTLGLGDSITLPFERGFAFGLPNRANPGQHKVAIWHSHRPSRALWARHLRGWEYNRHGPIGRSRAAGVRRT
jgi:hypothetical protein